jgi:hypothetical protein
LEENCAGQLLLRETQLLCLGLRPQLLQHWIRLLLQGLQLKVALVMHGKPSEIAGDDQSECHPHGDSKAAMEWELCDWGATAW